MTEEYDVFVSFKNLDEGGNPTPDAALAKEVHEFLTARMLNVFCASVSLEKLGTSAYKRAIDRALDSSHVLVAVGTTSENLDSPWVSYEWESFFSDVLSEIKPEGRVFAYVKGVPLKALPRALRQCQVINQGPDSLQRLFNFVANALGPRAEPHAQAQRRLEAYAKEHDNVFNIIWDSSQSRFDIELNGSSDWPSDDPCDPVVLDELAKPWRVHCWWSD